MGSINCDFPELAAAAAVWTIPVDSPCEEACTIGPFLGWYDTDIPYSERYVTLNVPEAGIYTVSLTSSADVGEVVLRLRPLNDAGDARRPASSPARAFSS